MKVYLDNCCYNRPYDDQTQLRISLESQAKLFIQDLIRRGDVQLVDSYILHYENSMNLHETRKTDIRLLKYKTDEIKMVNPLSFVTEWEEIQNDWIRNIE